MTEVVATTPGLFPLPDWAKERLSDLKGHQKGDLITGREGPDIVRTYDQAREEVVTRQQEAGLDRVVEGQLRWDDMLAHPLAVHDNVATRGIVRYYDNNNFYREPVVRGELTPSGDMADDLELANVDDGFQAVVPGPYSLFDLSTDEYFGDDEEFIAALAEFLAGEIASFPEHETLFLLEPSLVEEPPVEGFEATVSEAIGRVAGATDAEVVVHTYFGAVPEKTYAHLLDAEFDAVGFDLVSDHETSIYNIQEYGTKESIALGIVDGQNTRVETPERLRERIDWVQEQTPAQSYDTVYATVNTEPFYLPVNRFEEKLDVLGQLTAAEEVTA